MSYIVYKIQSVNSDHYYIGATGNRKAREVYHRRQIRKVILFNRLPPYIKKRNSLTATMNVHLFLAKQIEPLVRKYVSPDLIISRHYTFSVLNVCDTEQEARDVETAYLSISDKYSLNVAKKSCFIDKKKKC